MKKHIYISLLLALLAWGAPLLPAFIVGNGATAAAADVFSFTLVNADTDQDIQALAPGVVLDLGTLPTRNLNIRANTTTPVGSVVFSLTGAQTRQGTENISPYALFSDFQGDYFAWTPPLGSYSLVATPYDGPDGTGPQGAPLTLTFTVVSSVAAVTSFTLVNADTDQDIQALPPGAVVNLSAMPSRNLNVRANTNQLPVQSVRFDLSGPDSRNSVENTPPYALFSDLTGDYSPWTPAVGTYTLVATPYELTGGAGVAGVALTITFRVADSPLAVQLTAFLAEALDAGTVQLRWRTASEENNEKFVIERSPDGQVFAALASVAGQGTTSSAHSYSYDDKQLPAQAGVLYYRLRQVDTDGTASYSPVRSVVRGAAGPGTLQVLSPVVADGLVRYAYAGPTTGAERLEVYNVLGQRQTRFPLMAGGEGTVPVTGLASGTYILRLVSAQGRLAGRFVLP